MGIPKLTHIHTYIHRCRPEYTSTSQAYTWNKSWSHVCIHLSIPPMHHNYLSLHPHKTAIERHFSYWLFTFYRRPPPLLPKKTNSSQEHTGHVLTERSKTADTYFNFPPPSRPIPVLDGRHPLAIANSSISSMTNDLGLPHIRRKQQGSRHGPQQKPTVFSELNLPPPFYQKGLKLKGKVAKLHGRHFAGEEEEEPPWL